MLDATGADAIMIGRAAQGRPWIFRRDRALSSRPARQLPPPRVRDVRDWLLEHLDDHYRLYGEFAGVRSARKHIGWTVRGLPGGEAFRAEMNAIEIVRRAGARGRRLVRPSRRRHGAHARMRRAGRDDPLKRERMAISNKKHIEECVRESLEGYFRDLRGVEPTAMHEMILRVVERPLLEVVMKEAEGNQSRAAEWLGINRNTLRRKLLEHKLVK